MNLLKITYLTGTPVFVTAATNPNFSKVFGATRFQGNPLLYFPAFYPLHKFVLRDLASLKLAYTLSPSAQSVVRQLQQYDERIDKGVLPADFVFKTQPFKHQKDGLVHIFYNLRAALFYACGLGKTKIIIDWQRATKSKLLILCPSKVTGVWLQEVKRHGINQEFYAIDARTKAGKEKQILNAKDYDGLVISYDSARLYYELVVQSVPYTAIVADESHYIKSITSARTKVALELSKKARRRVIMSGTPSAGDPRDIYPQFRFLSTAIMAENAWKFKNSYCVCAKTNKHIVTGYKNLHVLNKRIQPVTRRRTLQECIDLPKQYIIDVPIQLYHSQRKVYNGLILSVEYADLMAELKKEYFLEKGRIEIPNAAILINKLIQVTSGFMFLKPDVPDICAGCICLQNCINENIRPYTGKCQVNSTPLKPVRQRMKDNAKLDQLEQKLDEIFVEPTNKCIIWAQFRPELDMIAELLTSVYGVDSFVRIDGTTTNTTALVNKFNADPNCRAYLGQVDTGVGLTLNAANYMIYFSLPWKLLSYDQSLERNHRVGQLKQVTVFRFLGIGTIDMQIANSLGTKRTVAETLVASIMCAHCEYQADCVDEKVTPYNEGCIYQRSVSKQTAHARLI